MNPTKLHKNRIEISYTKQFLKQSNENLLLLMRTKSIIILFIFVIIMYLCLFTSAIPKWIDGNQMIVSNIIDIHQNHIINDLSILIIKLLNQDNTPKFYDKTNGMGRKNRNKLYHNDEHKLLFCFIQKNANTMFRNLWFAVERKDPFIYHIDTRKKQNITDEPQPYHDNLHIYNLQNKEILNTRYREYLEKVVNKTWTKIVIIRDPLERVMFIFHYILMNYF